MRKENFSIKKFEDERGYLFEVFRDTELSIVMAYCVYTLPGEARDADLWHRHYTKSEYFIPISGVVSLAIDDSWGVLVHALDADRPRIVPVPPNCLHSLKNTGSEPAITLVLCDNYYNPSDEIRTPFEDWSWDNA